MLRRDSLLRPGGAGIRNTGRGTCQEAGRTDSFWLVESKVLGGLRRAEEFRDLEQKVAEQTEQRNAVELLSMEVGHEQCGCSWTPQVRAWSVRQLGSSRLEFCQAAKRKRQVDRLRVSAIAQS